MFRNCSFISTLTKIYRELSSLTRWIKFDVSRLTTALLFLRPHSSPVELVRIGGISDGAYYIPDDLDKISYCISPGVSTYKHFEDELMNRYGISSVLCDPTINAEDLCTPLDPRYQVLVRKWVTSQENRNSTTIAGLIDKYCTPDERDMILQIDIEGGEFEAINFCEKNVLERFRIIVIELHGLESLIAPWKKEYSEIHRLINRLSEDFVCIYAHANNFYDDIIIPGIDINLPQIIELTLLRRDRFKTNLRNEVHKIPDPGIMNSIINVTSRKPLDLNQMWFISDNAFIARCQSSTFGIIGFVLQRYLSLKLSALKRFLKKRRNSLHRDASLSI